MGTTTHPFYPSRTRSGPEQERMDVLKDTVESIILNPDLAPLLAIVKAARNGAVYGAKVRFPHALVMVLLFRSGSFREKIRLVLKATKQHAYNLATFAVVYKSAMLVLRLLNPVRPGKEGPYDTFFAGLLGGYTVFGRAKQGSVNQQIVIYVFASVSWAFVMYIFRWQPESIQPSLRSSMKYIYVNSDYWDSFRNFLIYNT